MSRSDRTSARGRIAWVVVLLALAGTAWLVQRAMRDTDSARRSERGAAAEREAKPRTDSSPTPQAPPAPRDDGADPSAESGPARDAPARKARPRPYREVADTGDPEHASLRVLVVDGTDHPIAGAEIGLTLSIGGVGRGGPSGKTDASGTALFERLRAEEVIAANVTSGSHWRSALLRLTNGKVTEIRFRMPGGAAGFPVKGTIRDVETGPIPRVMVTLSRSDEDGFTDRLHGNTDKDGVFAIEGVPPGTYKMTISGGSSVTTVTVTRDGEVTRERVKPRRIAYHERDRGEIEVTAPVEIDITLGRIAIEGVVRDAATGRPVDRVEVQLQSPKFAMTATDERGRFRVTSVPPGSYTILLRKDGYALKFVREVELPEGEAARVEFEIEPAARLEILLRDADGKPVTGEHWVRFDRDGGKGWSSNLRTDAEGRIRSDVVPLGPMKISVSGAGWKGGPVEIEIGTSENRVVIPLERTSGTGVRNLGGTVLDAKSGRPVEGAKLRFQMGMTRSAFSDEAGRFAFEDVRPGSYTVYVECDGYGDRTISGVKVEEGRPTKIEVRLQPAARIHLRVTDAKGSPVSGRVLFSYAGGTPLVGRGFYLELDEDGRASFSRLPPGPYRIRVLAEGRGAGSVETEVEPGENTLSVAIEKE